MRKLILGLAVSLDGFIEGPNGEYDWCFTDQDYGMSEFFKRVDAMFIGRKSYELMQSMGEDTVPGMPKLKEYVFSTTMTEVKNDSVLIRDNVEEEVKRIKNSPGKDIWLFGGASLTASLMNAGLVDEFWLSVHPIILGSGKPLFHGINGRVSLDLVHTKPYSTGLVSLTYRLPSKK
ncbi:MAG TPA: dihydrofolate reductase family protein [Flavisolibacter sp.]|jgi:dihydrofolate reductase|nr:dihydrofolate reductase family protein [Flavisolibacter sp.]